ncbi:hypothetical protein [Nocardioides marmoraquaticus]
MADGDEDTPGRDTAGPDLELPSLFRRRKDKRGRRGGQQPAGGTSDAPVAEDPATTEATEELPVTAAPVGADAPTQPLRPVPGATRRPPPAAPPAPPTSRDPQPEQGPEPEPPATEQPVAEETPPSRPPRPTGPPPAPRRRGPDMTWTEPRSEPTPAAETTEAPGRVAVAEAPGPTRAEQPEDESVGTGRRLPRPSLPSIDLRVPALSPRLAAAVVGVAVALTGIVLVWLSLQACTTVRGVSSCGGIGLLAIVLTLVAQGAVGTILLGVLGVAQQRSTAVLGVGIASFVAMLLLYASLPGLWLSVGLLVVTPVAFVLAEGVTSGRLTGSS